MFHMIIFLTFYGEEILPSRIIIAVRMIPNTAIFGALLIYGVSSATFSKLPTCFEIANFLKTSFDGEYMILNRLKKVHPMFHIGGSYPKIFLKSKLNATGLRQKYALCIFYVLQCYKRCYK